MDFNPASQKQGIAMYRTNARHKLLHYCCSLCLLLPVITSEAHSSSTTTAINPIASSAYSSKLQAISLTKAYHNAIDFAPDYQQTLYNNQATDDLVGINRASLLPSLNASASLSRSYDLHTNTRPDYGDGYGFTIQQTLFDWGSWKNLNNAQLNKRAALLNSAAALQNLMQQVAKDYFTVSLDQKQIWLLQRELENDEHLLKDVTAEYQAGKLYVVEKDNAIANVAGTKALLLAATTTLISDRNTLAKMTGNPLIKVYGLQQIPRFKLQSRSLQFWTNTTLAHNLSILSARYLQRASKQQINASYGEFLPSVSGSAAYNYERDLDDDGVIVPSGRDVTLSLNANWSLYAGGKSYYQVKRNKKLYAAALENTRLVTQQYIAQCRSAFNRTINDEIQIKLNHNVVILKKKAWDHTLAVYRQGIAQYTIQNVIAAEEAYYAAENALLSSEYDYLNAIIQLREAAGTLTYATLYKINQWLQK